MDNHVIGILVYGVILAVASGLLSVGLKSKSAFLQPFLLIIGGTGGLVGGLGVLVNLFCLFGL